VSTRQVLASEPISRAWLKELLLAQLDGDAQELDADDNLMDFGLDSIQVMGLIAAWEKRGLVVRFEELARQPTLNAWWDLLARRQAA
jgi:bifunctional isochorismate lyase/aryl carrier protein